MKIIKTILNWNSMESLPKEKSDEIIVLVKAKDGDYFIDFLSIYVLGTLIMFYFTDDNENYKNNIESLENITGLKIVGWCDKIEHEELEIE